MTGPSDRIVLAAMRFDAHVGVTEAERVARQPVEVDVELLIDLAEAGRTDELAATVDYGSLFDRCRGLVEGGRFRLIEAVAERVAAEVLSTTRSEQVIVRVRKLRVPLAGRLDHAGVEIVRRRTGDTAAGGTG